MKPSTVLVNLFFVNVLMGQNLVLNPSFETHKKCPWHIGDFSSNVSNWSTPNMSTTDFFNSCSEKVGVKNYNGYQIPKNGNAYAGIYVYTDKNYREYAQGELSSTLIKGKKYKMTFYLSLADQSSYAIKDIKVLFTEEKLKPCYNSNHCEKAIIPSKMTKKQFELYSNSEMTYFSDKESWMAYTFEFTSEGYENYFSIGNFLRNPKTEKQKVISSSPLFFSYYYIDDVSVEPLEQKPKISKTKAPKEEPVLKPNEIYILNNVLFDFNKSELLDDSILELDKLYNHLANHSELNIEIHGHTDNVGLETRNQELSEQRAKAVADYLISKGIDTSRIKSFGFGSSQPLDINDTEDRRQQNRRVAFKLIKN